MFMLSSSSRVVLISKTMTYLLPTLVLLSSSAYSVSLGSQNPIKSATFLSEKFELGPGRVATKNILDIEMPRGHIGVKSFDAELVDEDGNSVPLYETYLHHWFALKFFTKNNISNESEIDRNAGTCDNLSHHWGLGVESRGTPSKVPDPFAIEIGNPASIPAKFNEEKWVFSIMAIDTRGTKDRKSCTECKCDVFNLPKDFYNITHGMDGKLITPAYKGGIHCCGKGFQCKLKKGFQAPTRKLSLRYNITWVDWNESQIPLMFYILDSTDRVRMNGSEAIHNCQAEYTIPPKSGDSKYHVQKANVPIKKGGYLIYCTAHTHSGVVNITLYSQDGRPLCTSTPKYGTGMEPGNEKGYNVGMSVSYPKPGSIKINDGETLTVESVYQSGFRTGVMGHMYIYVAEKLPQ